MISTVADIKAKVRKLSGKLSTGQLSDVDLLEYINDYYQGVFPQEVQIKSFTQFVEFDTVASTGTKAKSAIDASIVDIHGPVYLDGDEINFWTDNSLFFQEYPLSGTDTGKPNDVLLFGETLYIRPIPDDAYTIKLVSTFDTPTAFTDDADEPADSQWCLVIAYGTAIAILNDSGDKLSADDITPMYRFYRSKVIEKQLQKEPSGQRATPRF